MVCFVAYVKKLWNIDIPLALDKYNNLILCDKVVVSLHLGQIIENLLQG